ncbi:MAG TPA: hypothetical protein QGF58_11005 [Myxococcota bacterium]|nr:hypothetical protein [Myxococcota bacterium]
MPWILLACVESGLNKQTPDVAEPHGVASLEGRSCRPDGHGPLVGGSVTVVARDGEVIVDAQMAVADTDGVWGFSEVPAGLPLTVSVQWKGAVIQSYELELVDAQNETVVWEGCSPLPELSVLVVEGYYDDFAAVLSAVPNLSVETLDGSSKDALLSLLQDPTRMADHDVLFFDGGHVEEGVIWGVSSADQMTALEVQQNLADYVSAGGGVYASDWAYDVVEQTWPDKLDFLGEDTVPDAAQYGVSEAVSSTVSNASLAEYLGTDEVDITFDLPVWPVVVGGSDYTSVHLVGDVTYQSGEVETPFPGSPLLVSFHAGEGRVVFSSFRQQANTDEMREILEFALFHL